MSWLIEIKNKFEHTSLVKVFGVIVYDYSQPNLIKVLRDHDYWKALDKNSGDKIAIFSIKPPSAAEIMDSEMSPRISDDIVGYFVPVAQEISNNTKALKALGIKRSRQLPLLVIFAEFNQEIYTSEIKLLHKTVDEAYSCLNDNVIAISEAIENVKNERLGSAEGIFTTISHALDQRIKFKYLKKTFNFYNWIKDSLP